MVYNMNCQGNLPKTNFPDILTNSQPALLTVLDTNPEAEDTGCIGFFVSVSGMEVSPVNGSHELKPMQPLDQVLDFLEGVRCNFHGQDLHRSLLKVSSTSCYYWVFVSEPGFFRIWPISLEI